MRISGDGLGMERRIGDEGTFGGDSREAEEGGVSGLKGTSGGER